MNSADILSFLETPRKDRRPLLYQIRDGAAVSVIVAALRTSSDPQTRQALCYILTLRAGAERCAGASLETKQAIPALIEALADPDAGVRAEAIDALGQIGDSTAGPALLEAYHHTNDDAGVRTLLASALGFCQYRPAIPTLLEALSSSESLLRRQATWGLRHLQAQEAREPLRKALAHESDPLTRQTMQATLEELEHPTTAEEKIDRLISQLSHAETAQEREAAATAVGAMDQRVLVPLLALLSDQHGEVRHAAVAALFELSDHRDADWFVRAHRQEVQGLLIQALADPVSQVRAAAAQALGRWGDQLAVEPLLAVIQDPDVDVRRQVVATLSPFMDERTLEPLLHAFFTDEDWSVRTHAAEGLGRHPEDTRAVQSLIQALQDEQGARRQQAAELLCWLKDERATDALIQALQDLNPEVRAWGMEALWELCSGKGDELSPETIEKMRLALGQALQDEQSEVRAGAEKMSAWLESARAQQPKQGGKSGSCSAKGTASGKGTGDCRLAGWSILAGGESVP